jgi:hypothetical protein
MDQTNGSEPWIELTASWIAPAYLGSWCYIDREDARLRRRSMSASESSRCAVADG